MPGCLRAVARNLQGMQARKRKRCPAWTPKAQLRAKPMDTTPTASDDTGYSRLARLQDTIEDTLTRLGRITAEMQESRVLLTHAMTLLNASSHLCPDWDALVLLRANGRGRRVRRPARRCPQQIGLWE
jgi:hypothetical protein